MWEEKIIIHTMDMHRFIFFFIISIISINFGGANCGNLVEHLPGLDLEGPLPFHLETGYVGVDKNEDVQLFYYFIRSESNPKEDPLILWFSGGPGCSSFYALLYEIGPIELQAVRDKEVHYDGSLPTLNLSSTSWTKVANIIFIDGPVGTGFSYARIPSASYSTDIQYCDQVYEFITKWLESNPEFISNPLYIGGDSYSGLTVPIIAQVISNGNEADIVPYINLKGYILGNPLTTPDKDNYQIRFANAMGLISDKHYKKLFDSCDGEYRPKYINSNNTGCLQNIEWFNECIDGIDTAQVTEPYCGYRDSPIKLLSEKFLKEKGSSYSFYCRTEAHKLVVYWANDVRVREALHIRKGSVAIGDWVRCNWDVNYTTLVNDVRPYHRNLSQKGYRSLIYSGDHDMIVPHYSTESWIKDLNYPIIDDWRSWKLHGQISGYTESYNNMMTYVTIKGGGHIAPEYKPEECFTMFKRWISHQQL